MFRPPPDLQHVKGHQDAGTPIDFLDLPSQFNVEADTLATMELQEYGSIKEMVPFDPDSGIQLNINGCTITRQLTGAIHNQQHLAPIRKYYRTRFSWSSECFVISWPLYMMAYRRFPRQRTFFSKLGWKKLPVAGRLHKRAPCYDHRCPTCSDDHESDDHVYQCQHASQALWRTSILDKIYDTFHPILDPDLMAIIRIGLRAYFNDSLPDFSECFPTGYSTTPYNDVIVQQNAIGWDHFICGKVTKEWQRVQYMHAKRYGLVKQSEGWVRDLIKLMANSPFQLWELRNQCRHGHDNATRQQSMSEQAHREIRCLYLLQPQVLIQDKNIFRASVDDHLSELVPQLCSWIVHNKKLILHSVKVAKAQAKLHTHQIQSFFPLRGVRQSKTATNRPLQVPRRQRLTRISNFFTALTQPSTFPLFQKTLSSR
jgi:hypothetical protein